jgi:hypothetical protein
MQQTHPMFNPAVATEMTMRERVALMAPDDWEWSVEKALDQMERRGTVDA